MPGKNNYTKKGKKKSSIVIHVMMIKRTEGSEGGALKSHVSKNSLFIDEKQKIFKKCRK